ncbi:MAG: class II fumarate hydratase [Rickettsia sp.]|nr:class II fumarate hydratase [Rickettsia sp.]
MKNFRFESDSIGQIEVDINSYWGAQTQRSIENFSIGQEKMPISLIKALIIIKICAARINKESNILDKKIADAILDAGNFLLHDRNIKDKFPLSVWQTGSGTQSNMNVNEVISCICNERLEGNKNCKTPVHPNDHVNKSQSSNDSFPTAMNIAIVQETQSKLMPALENLKKILYDKSEEWKDIIKIGRTHMQDATPITFGQEFSGYYFQIHSSIKRIKKSLEELHFLPQGGTAVGTGLNAPKDFDKKIVKAIAEFTKLEFQTSKNKFEALATNDSIVEFAGSINGLAVSLMKIANDIRLLSSGPRCGLNEIILPSNEPGSSIMPGKVNPTQCEALSMVCAQVMGSYHSIVIGGSNGHLELNVFRPLVIYNILSSINILSDSIMNFAQKAIAGMKINHDQIEIYKARSLMQVTALNPYIGYDKSAQIAKKAFAENLSLKEAAVKLDLLSEKEFEQYINLQKMV